MKAVDTRQVIGKHPPVSLTIILVLFCLQFLIPFLNSGAAGSGTPLISIMDGEEEQYADVRPGNDNTVTFPCIVNSNYFDDSEVSDLSCTFEALADLYSYTRSSSVESNWPISIEPETLELKMGELKRFDVIVEVPSGTSYTSRGELRIFGTVTTQPDGEVYSINDVYGVVRINYYEDWSLKSSDMSKSVKKGEKVVFEVDIANLGNGKDVFFQTIENDIALKRSNIYLDFPANTEIDEKEARTIEISVDTSTNTPDGVYFIELYSYPIDINKVDLSGDPFYLIKFKLTVEQGLVEKYLYPSVIVTAIVIIIIAVKLFKPKLKLKSKGENQKQTEVQAVNYY